MSIHPRLAPIIVMILATSFIWGSGAWEIFENPSDPISYGLLGFVLYALGYVATERVEISDGIVRTYRLFRKTGEAPVADTEIVRAQVGTPPMIDGFVLRRRGTGAKVGELISWNYSQSDLDRLTTALSGR